MHIRQQIRIPREFDLEGDDVVIEKHGDGVLIRPARSDFKDLTAWLKAQPPLGPEDAFPEIENYPPGPVEL